MRFKGFHNNVSLFSSYRQRVELIFSTRTCYVCDIDSGCTTVPQKRGDTQGPTNPLCRNGNTPIDTTIQIEDTVSFETSGEHFA